MKSRQTIVMTIVAELVDELRLWDHNIGYQSQSQAGKLT